MAASPPTSPPDSPRSGTTCRSASSTPPPPLSIVIGREGSIREGGQISILRKESSFRTPGEPSPRSK